MQHQRTGKYTLPIGNDKGMLLCNYFIGERQRSASNNTIYFRAFPVGERLSFLKGSIEVHLEESKETIKKLIWIYLNVYVSYKTWGVP